MMKRYLTPSEIQELDPYGLNTRTVNRFKAQRKLTTERPSQYCRLKPDEMIGRYRDILKRQSEGFQLKHRPYLEYNQEMFAKTGPQGGMYEFETMISLLEESYLLAQRSIAVTEPLLVGRDYLLSRIKEAIGRFGYPQEQPIVIYNTNAAIPTGLKKGTYQAETIGFKGAWNHVQPDLLGQRYMRLKKRLIHQDSVINVRSVERMLTKVRRWLVQYLPDLFSAWARPDKFMTPMITRYIDRRFISVETDFKQMDNHFSLQIARTMILPIYELLLDEGEYLHLAAYVEECFHQEVFMGTYCFTGLHNLFSGQGITNDFETIYSAELGCGSVLTNDGDLRQVLILVNGDDSSLIMNTAKGSSFGPKIAESVMKTSIEASNLAGLDMSEEKCRMSTTEVRFCRQVYYESGPRDINCQLYGAYPTILALNNIVQPERPGKTPGIANVADLQRLDNCYGSPDWKLLVDFVARYRTISWEVSQEDMAMAPIDWWERLYGERWAPESSPSFQYINRTRK